MTLSFGLWDLSDIKDLSNTCNRQSQNYNDLSAEFTYHMSCTRNEKKKSWFTMSCCKFVVIIMKTAPCFPSEHVSFGLKEKKGNLFMQRAIRSWYYQVCIPISDKVSMHYLTIQLMINEGDWTNPW